MKPQWLKYREEILSSLDRWDGKSVEALEGLYRNYSANDDFAKVLEDWADSVSTSIKLQNALSHLLKQHCDNGYIVLAKQSHSILSVLENEPHWQTLLHILQSFKSFELVEEYRDSWERILKSALSCENKFVRAWSYYAWALFADHFPRYGPEVNDYIEMALRDEAPSVKARIRQMQKQGLI
ncbi:hypothetical protein [uncultured Pseudoteredinibacter sp.]|uniref:hypothetical protein n=1 Tax=uncultured Pseudoteredinibacter sp. TaxID=1641701 RepID=UPI002636B244|nr:hypothetical protein [uncultured Pseudoteredinibacter sp.]